MNARLTAPLLFSAFLLSLPALALDDDYRFDEATRTRLVDEAQGLRDRADRLKSDAEARFANEEAACYKKFLVNDCRVAAKQAQSQSMVEVRQLESQARAIDRRVRRRDAVVHAGEQAEAQPQRAADQAAQAEQYHDGQARAAASREQKAAEREKANAAAQRNAAARAHDIDESARRQAERDKRVAEKAAERAKKAAEQQ